MTPGGADAAPPTNSAERQTGAATLSGRIAGSALLAFAILYGILAVNIEYSFSSDPLGPTAVPLLLALLLGALGLWYTLRPGAAEPWPGGAAARDLVLLLAGTALLVRLIPVLGFPLSISILAAMAAAMFGARGASMLAIGVAQGVGWWALFWALGVPLPGLPNPGEFARLLEHPLGF